MFESAFEKKKKMIIWKHRKISAFKSQLKSALKKKHMIFKTERQFTKS